MIQDMPAEWPKAVVISDTAAAKNGKKQNSKAKAKPTPKAKPETEDVKPTPAPESKPKSAPSLLTNLVRCGNQMGNSSSWAIIENALKDQIATKLKIKPLSALTPHQRLQHEQENIKTLTLLGIWQTPAQLEIQKKTAIMASAEELIMSHVFICSVKFCVFLVDLPW